MAAAALAAVRSAFSGIRSTVGAELHLRGDVAHVVEDWELYGSPEFPLNRRSVAQDIASCWRRALTGQRILAEDPDLVEDLAQSNTFALVPVGIDQPAWDVWLTIDPQHRAVRSLFKEGTDAHWEWSAGIRGSEDELLVEPFRWPSEYLQDFFKRNVGLFDRLLDDPFVSMAARRPGTIRLSPGPDDEPDVPSRFPVLDGLPEFVAPLRTSAVLVDPDLWVLTEALDPSGFWSDERKEARTVYELDRRLGNQLASLIQAPVLLRDQSRYRLDRATGPVDAADAAALEWRTVAWSAQAFQATDEQWSRMAVLPLEYPERAQVPDDQRYMARSLQRLGEHCGVWGLCTTASDIVAEAAVAVFWNDSKQIVGAAERHAMATLGLRMADLLGKPSALIVVPNAIDAAILSGFVGSELAQRRVRVTHPYRAITDADEPILTRLFDLLDYRCIPVNMPDLSRARQWERQVNVLTTDPEEWLVLIPIGRITDSFRNWEQARESWTRFGRGRPFRAWLNEHLDKPLDTNTISEAINLDVSRAHVDRLVDLCRS